MKWTNPGHEFDKIKHSLKDMENIYIYGAGRWGEHICKIIFSLSKWLKWQIAFIDFNEEKQNIGFMGLTVLSPGILCTLDKSKNFIVVCANEENLPVMMKNAEKAGFIQKKNLFDYWFLLSAGMSIYFFYNLNMTYIYSANIIPSTVCNLNCVGCSAFIPHIKNHIIYSLDVLRENIDIFFGKIDLVYHFYIGGGEVLLYPNLLELIEYIGKRYRSKIIYFELVLNCTIIPNNKLCEVFNKYKMSIYLSDYSKTVPLAKVNIEKVYLKLIQFNDINVIRKDIELWWDFAPNLFIQNKYAEDELIEHFTYCNNWGTTLVDKSISSCTIGHFAEKAEIVKYCKDSYLELSKIDSSNKAELVEFICRYNLYGYVKFCKYCVGVRNNNNFINSAVQV